MQSTLLASGLGFPEGPTIMGDGRIVLCDGNTGELLVYDDGAVSAYARTGGSPWGTVLGSDGAIYVTQGGNVPGSGDISAVSGIQRVSPDGTVELLFSRGGGVSAVRAERPGLRARRPAVLHRVRVGAGLPVRRALPGRLFAVDGSGDRRDAAGTAGRLPERDRLRRATSGSTGPSRWRTASAGWRTAKPVTFCQLSDDHVPDGMAFAADGRLFVATTVSQGVTVISPDGQVLAEINLGEHATNCAFDGPALYVTATRSADIEASERTGTFWRVDTDADGGLELIPGRL